MEFVGYILIYLVVLYVLHRQLMYRKWYRNLIRAAGERFKSPRTLIESVTSLKRGTWSERNFVLRLLKSEFPAGAIFHDLYLVSKSYKTAQIDVVLATSVGIFVFEIKDYGGWIFGKGNQRWWRQVLAYGRYKLPFYNPVWQNESHIIELRNQSKQFSKIPVYSVIVFYGRCVLRNVSNIPNNVIVTNPRHAIRYVQNIVQNSEPAPYTDKREILSILKSAVNNGNNPQILEAHSRHVNKMPHVSIYRGKIDSN